MAWWEALILGIVQGITEFFPVSSSGHLVMTERLLGLDLPGIGFAVALHVGTLISVMIVYREKLLALARGAFRRGDDSSWPYLLKLAVATVPVAVVGLSLKDWFEARFDDPIFAATMILVTGAVVWSTRWALSTHRFGIAELAPLAASGATVFAMDLIPRITRAIDRFAPDTRVHLVGHYHKPK